MNTTQSWYDLLFTPWREELGVITPSSALDWHGPQRLDAIRANHAAQALRSGRSPGRPAIVRVDPLVDWLHPAVPLELLADLLALIHGTPNLSWLMTTSRPGLWGKRLSAVYELYRSDEPNDAFMNWLGRWIHDDGPVGSPPGNVWLGSPVEQLPELLKVPARVRFAACEPLLGPVHLRKAIKGEAHIEGNVLLEGIHWVLCGCETGPRARPTHPDEVRSLRDQCQAAGVPFLFTGWGEWLPYSQVTTQAQDAAFDREQLPGGSQTYFGARIVPGPQGPTTGTTPGIRAESVARIGKYLSRRLLDGVEHNEFPEVWL